MMNDREIHALYNKAYEVCRRADRQGRQYVAFRNDKRNGFKLMVSRDDFGGRSSCRMGLFLHDWAQNVLYRLRDLGLIEADLDGYFEKLHKTGYERDE